MSSGFCQRKLLTARAAAAALGVLFLASCSLEGDTDYGFIGQHIPRLATYVIEINGSAEIDDEPTGVTWTVPASISVQPTFGVGSVTNNGLNSVEVGLFTHTSPLKDPVGPGYVYLATHTAMRTLGADVIPEGPTYDVVFMNIDGGAGTVQTAFDSGILGLTGLSERTINRFFIGTGDTAQRLVLHSGTFNLTFSNGGANLQGTLHLVGAIENDYPLNTRYTYEGTFTGTRTY